MHFLALPIIIKIKQQNTNVMFAMHFLTLHIIIWVKTAKYNRYDLRGFFGLAHIISV
jgi:hypothetical protein